jgi:hypothetical protein
MMNPTQYAPGAEEVGDVPIDVPFAGAAGGVGTEEVYIGPSRNGAFREGLYDATSEPWLY